MNSLLKLKKVHEKQKRVPFFSLIDLLTIEPSGLIVGVSGRLGLSFAVEGADYLFFDEDRKEAFFKDLARFLNQLPEEITISFLQRKSKMHAFRSIFEQTSDHLAREINRSKLAHSKTQRLLRTDLFLFLSLENNPRSKKISLENESLLYDAESLVLRFFESLGIKIRRLSKEEVLWEYFKKLNPSLAKLLLYPDVFHEESIEYPRFETLRSRTLLHPPQVNDHSVYLDGFHHEVINLRLLPSEVWDGITKAFEFSLPDEHEWLLTIRKPNQEDESSRLRVRANLAHANSFLKVSEDHFAGEKARQYEAFLGEAAAENEAIFEISSTVLVKDESLEGLKKKRQEALKAFSKLGQAVGVSDHFEHDFLFLSHLPLQGNQMNPIHFPILTNALTRLVPVLSEWKGCEKGDVVLKTHRDEVLKLDLFDPSLPAKHAFMIGSTGSGKSFTTNFLLTHFLAGTKNNHVVILDVGGSYRKLTQVFGGSYLEIDCSENYAMNPFPSKKRFFLKEGEFDSELLSFLVTLVEKMLGEKEKLHPSDSRILEKAILWVYERLSQDETPILSDIQNVLMNFKLGDEEDFLKARRYGKNLSLWTEGRFGRLLNKKESLSLDNRLIVFDLRKLSHYPELQSILFFVIRSVLTRKLEDLSLRKMIVIDEGWRFFDDEIGARLIEELYRTARKTNSLVLSISQTPEDFLKSHASTAILANSYVKYVLKLQKGYDELLKFDLNPNEVKACEELEIRPGIYSELFIKFHEHAVLAKIEPSSLEYWIATTDPDDLLAEDEMRRKFPDLSYLELLKKLAAEYPRGMRAQKDGV